MSNVAALLIIRPVQQSNMIIVFSSSPPLDTLAQMVLPVGVRKLVASGVKFSPVRRP
jgi:hypothetical protein